MITKPQTAELLTIIAAFDRRTLGEADVEAWHLILHDLNQPDCAEAITSHYAQTNRWIMPADVRQAALTIARQRAGQQRRHELDQAIEAEQRAIEATPTEPIDRQALANQLRALATTSRPITKAADPRRDHARLAEARAQVAEVAAREHQTHRTNPSTAPRTSGPVKARMETNE